MKSVYNLKHGLRVSERKLNLSFDPMNSAFEEVITMTRGLHNIPS